MNSTLETTLYRFLMDPQCRLVRHLALFGIVNLIIWNMGFPEEVELANPWNTGRRWIVYSGYVCLFMGMFYFHIYYVVPRFLLQNHFTRFFVCFILFIPIPLVAAMGFQYFFLSGFKEAFGELGGVLKCFLC